jgi:hypothetical protein
VLELLTSKIAMMVAAIVILTSVLGIFSMQREDTKELELRNITDKITVTINNMNTIMGETKEIITFKEGEDGIFLKPKVDGKTYEITITRYEVIVRQDAKTFLRNFIEDIHLWVPEKTEYNSTQIQDINKENMKLDFISGADFVIQRKLIEIDGEKGYMTFVNLVRG